MVEGSNFSVQYRRTRFEGVSQRHVRVIRISPAIEEVGDLVRILRLARQGAQRRFSNLFQVFQIGKMSSRYVYKVAVSTREDAFYVERCQRFLQLAVGRVSQLHVVSRRCR